MPTIAIASLAGGVGRTTLMAHLATLAARSGHWSLALEWDPQNAAALHFGAGQPPVDGLAARAERGEPWHEAALRSGDGVLLLPFGEIASGALCRWQSRLEAEPHWLHQALSQLNRPASGWTFIDTPRAPCTLLASAAHAADAVLLVLRADAAAAAQIDAATALADGRPFGAVINGFDAAQPLQVDVQAALLDALGDRLSPYSVHRDAAVPEAFARQLALPDAAPHAQAHHDLHGLWRWLQDRFGTFSSLTDAA
jgi:cellulose synthase operon protein YhjQ